MTHPLHIKVAEVLQHRLKNHTQLLRDPACGGKYNLPLFFGANNRLETRMCNVDLLVISGDQVSVIVEIEESGFLPTKIFGKFLQSAIATHFINEAYSELAITYGNRVLFIQVLDGLKCLKQGTHKDLQCKLIERQIRNVLPINGSCITNYHLFFVKGVNDHVGLESVGAAVAGFLLE